MRRKVYIPVAVFLVMCFACTMNMALKPWSEQTHKERLTWMMGVYNAQDRDYRSMAAMPNLTDAQKKVLVGKRAIMLKAYPLIEVYRTTVESGGVPDQNAEQQILNLLNQLVSVGG